MNRQQAIEGKRSALELHKHHKRNAKQAIERLKREIAELEARGPSLPEPNENTIRFSKKYVTFGTTYKFAATRANGLWYVTGSQSPQGITWEQLSDFIEKDNITTVGYWEAPAVNNFVGRSS